MIKEIETRLTNMKKELSEKTMKSIDYCICDPSAFNHKPTDKCRQLRTKKKRKQSVFIIPFLLLTERVKIIKVMHKNVAFF